MQPSVYIELGALKPAGATGPVLDGRDALSQSAAAHLTWQTMQRYSLPRSAGRRRIAAAAPSNAGNWLQRKVGAVGGGIDGAGRERTKNGCGQSPV